jgi:hypothetical protein
MKINLISQICLLTVNLLFCCDRLVSAQAIDASSLFEDGSVSFRIVDGRIFNAAGDTEVGNGLMIDRVEADIAILNLVADDNSDIDVSMVTRDGIRINRDDIISGFVQADSTSDFNTFLTRSQPFSNALDLSPDQLTEIKKIRLELINELKFKAKSIDDPTALNQLWGEMNVEFSRRLMSVLLPFQHKALIKFSVESVGFLPSISRLCAGNVLESNIDAEKAKELALVQLDKIESAVLKLKKDLANDIVSLLSSHDRKKIEMALESDIEQLIVKGSLDDLQKQLELVKNSGVPRFTTLREFAEKLSEDDRTQTPNKPK